MDLPYLLAIDSNYSYLGAIDKEFGKFDPPFDFAQGRLGVAGVWVSIDSGALWASAGQAITVAAPMQAEA